MKDKRLIVRVSDEELESIRTNATKAGLPISAFVLEKTLHSRTEFTSEEALRELRELKIEIQRQGNNLNQIARSANTKLNPVSAAVMTRQLSKINEALEEIYGHYKVRSR